jgi:hypothetical protein
MSRKDLNKNGGVSSMCMGPQGCVQGIMEASTLSSASDKASLQQQKRQPCAMWTADSACTTAYECSMCGATAMSAGHSERSQQCQQVHTPPHAKRTYSGLDVSVMAGTAGSTDGLVLHYDSVYSDHHFLCSHAYLIVSLEHACTCACLTLSPCAAPGDFKWVALTWQLTAQ